MDVWRQTDYRYIDPKQELNLEYSSVTDDVSGSKQERTDKLLGDEGEEEKWHDSEVTLKVGTGD